MKFQWVTLFWPPPNGHLLQPVGGNACKPTELLPVGGGGPEPCCSRECGPFYAPPCPSPPFFYRGSVVDALQDHLSFQGPADSTLCSLNGSQCPGPEARDRAVASQSTASAPPSHWSIVESQPQPVSPPPPVESRPQSLSPCSPISADDTQRHSSPGSSASGIAPAPGVH